MAAIKTPTHYSDHIKHAVFVLEETLKLLPNVKVIIFNNVNSSIIIKDHYNKLLIKDCSNGLYKMKDIYYDFGGMMNLGRLDVFSLEKKGDVIRHILGLTCK